MKKSAVKQRTAETEVLPSPRSANRSRSDAGLEGRSPADKIRFMVRRELAGIKQQEPVRKALNFVLQKHLTAEKFIRTPGFVRTQDKTLFTLGVVNVTLLAYLCGHSAWVVPHYYTFFFSILIPLRFFTYHQTKSHFFLIDFCYLANLSLLFYLYMMPYSDVLFSLCYAVSHGPLLWAVVTWNNKLVFFSLDYMTSVFIHAMPPIVCYLIRWNAKDPAFSSDYAVRDTLSFWQTYVPVILLHIYWQIGYYIKTEVIEVNRMPEDAVTSYRYLTGEGKKGMVGRILCGIPPVGGLRYVGFIVLQFMYTMLSIAPVPLLYRYRLVNLAVLVMVLIVCVWNGAVFFIDSFSHKYVERLEELRQALLAEAVVDDVLRTSRKDERAQLSD